MNTTRSHLRAVFALLAIVHALLPTSAGCSRNRYYSQADKEAKQLIAEKSCDPRWLAPPNFTIDVDSRSRLYDPCNEIFPPMPPDDPASHRFMHCIDGKKGFALWHANGDRARIDNPEWREKLGEIVEMTDDGRVKLTLESAVKLAYLNSDGYQTQLEELYLSALDVSTERFSFATQFFGGNATSFTHEGALSGGGETNTLETDTSFRLQREFATAGTIVVGFANSIMWQFAGPETFSNVSILNFNLVQPLLRNAGRAFALEQLTIVERALLANLRALQLYRQGFFAEVAVGGGPSASVQRRGGFFSGTGMTGFSGTGVGGFGGLGGVYFGGGGAGLVSGGGGGGGGSFAGGGAGSISGFFGLLQQRQEFHNVEQQFDSKLRALSLLEAHLQAGTIDLTQVDQMRQEIETQRATLLQSRNGMASVLENYKISTLGLPPDLPVELDDTFIRQFQFISSETSNIQHEFGNYLSEFGDEPNEPEIEALHQWFRRLADLRSRVERHSAAIEEDIQNTEKHSAERMAAMTPAERKLFIRDINALRGNLKDLRERVQQSESKITELEGRLTPATRRQTADQLVHLVTEISGAMDEMSLIQARARVETITLKQERIDPDEALDIARANRLDWMNNRAALVDTWRLIQFNANKLRSDLNVVFSGDMSTVGNNPAQFRAPTGSLRVGLQFDAPFTRLVERNSFRMSIIDYQQQRRNMIQFEDSIQESLRQSVRTLELDKVNLEIQRRAAIIAIRRVDQTREVLNQPPPPPQPGQTTGQLGPTAVTNLMTAFNDLGATQNNLMSIWLNHYATRLNLARQMGVMQLDENGLWIDQPLSTADRLKADESPLPPSAPDDLIEQLEKIPTPPAEKQAKPPAPAKSPKNKS